MNKTHTANHIFADDFRLIFAGFFAERGERICSLLEAMKS